MQLCIFGVEYTHGEHQQGYDCLENELLKYKVRSF